MKIDVGMIGRMTVGWAKHQNAASIFNLCSIGGASAGIYPRLWHLTSLPFVSDYQPSGQAAVYLIEHTHSINYYTSVFSSGWAENRSWAGVSSVLCLRYLLFGAALVRWNRSLHVRKASV